MADVDDLLAELDAELSAKPKRPSASSSSSHTNKPGPTSRDYREQENSRPHGRADDIDSLLADLGDMGGPPPPAARPKPSPPPRPAAAPSAYASPGSMPFPSSSSSGGGGSSGERTASGLRCSKCDFRVLRFHDSVWAGDVDYMFFRNFMPNVSKLEAKLSPSDGNCAFACQCAWASAELGMPTGVSHWFMAR